MRVETELTEEDLEKLELLCEKATPGPWEAFCRDSSHNSSNPDWQDQFLGWEISGPESARGRGYFNRGWDAHLMAKARTALPALIRDNRRLFKLLDEALKKLEEIDG